LPWHFFGEPVSLPELGVAWLGFGAPLGKRKGFVCSWLPIGSLFVDRHPCLLAGRPADSNGENLISQTSVCVHTYVINPPSYVRRGELIKHCMCYFKVFVFERKSYNKLNFQ
jgi:hypothetical protein